MLDDRSLNQSISNRRNANYSLLVGAFLLNEYRSQSRETITSVVKTFDDFVEIGVEIGGKLPWGFIIDPGRPRSLS